MLHVCNFIVEEGQTVHKLQIATATFFDIYLTDLLTYKVVYSAAFSAKNGIYAKYKIL